MNWPDTSYPEYATFTQSQELFKFVDEELTPAITAQLKAPKTMKACVDQAA
jgi:hypothetical protein